MQHTPERHGAPFPQPDPARAAEPDALERNQGDGY
jgi:hypothetical protein